MVADDLTEGLDPGFDGAEALLCAWRRGRRPDPDLTVSEWADQHRKLFSRASAEPGQYRTARTPYLREIMDTLSSRHPAQRISFHGTRKISRPACQRMRWRCHGRQGHRQDCDQPTGISVAAVCPRIRSSDASAAMAATPAPPRNAVWYPARSGAASLPPPCPAEAASDTITASPSADPT
ncbi:phage terminase large subunit family protein [Frigidibacter mobilis]|uniref:phage terminase large subunit family protein n=1 Tax=Frigidibacter mobilis TaxID=1335048 RepID=UPI003AACC4BD